MRSILLLGFLIFSEICVAATATPGPTPTQTPTPAVLSLPAQTEQLKYRSPHEKNILRNRHSIIYLGAHLGLKNGFGTDFNYCKAIQTFFCAGLTGFAGSLNSNQLVRPLIQTTVPGAATPETPPATTEYQDILDTPETWSAFVPQLQFTAFGPLIFTDDDRWSDSASVAVGPAFIGGRTGWAVSFEPGIHRQFNTLGNWGISVKGKYTFGWLNPKNNGYGTIPFEWFNFSTGIYYLW
jgi:hypothetical protein